jgi:hypothetical protein
MGLVQGSVCVGNSLYSGFCQMAFALQRMDFGRAQAEHSVKNSAADSNLCVLSLE